jgi:NADP-dependent 3-hydroxy acid dehydrogenase YdfG
MLDATANPRTLLLLGGTSDIALAIARAYAAESPVLRVLLAARPSEARRAAAGALGAEGVQVREIDLDARAAYTHAATIEMKIRSGSRIDRNPRRSEAANCPALTRASARRAGAADKAPAPPG